MKSIYENTKSLLDPTPCFDSHISKNASKVTSLTSYRAFEHTQVHLRGGKRSASPWSRRSKHSPPLTFQQYFYEYVCAELTLRPRQVLPYAVVSFSFKGKDSALPAAPLAPVRLAYFTSLFVMRGIGLGPNEPSECPLCVGQVEQSVQRGR